MRIGVFDSGMGGLTVLAALRARLPDCAFVYLGDTARLPYGTKSAATVSSYALSAASALVQHEIDVLVVACNTASAVALAALRSTWPDLPVVGVVEPGARAAVAQARTWPGGIGVIATESTVRGGAYQRAIARLAPELSVRTRACSVFVALAEEGWLDTPVSRAAAHAYLDPWFRASNPPGVLLMGCTHFPVLAPMLASLLGPGVKLVDSASTTAERVAALIDERGGPDAARSGRGSIRFLATDGAARFAEVGSMFLGTKLAAGDVEIVDLPR